MGRRESRETAVKVIFQYEFQEKTADELVNGYFENIDDYESDEEQKTEDLEKDYILEVVKGTLEHRKEFLELIDKTATDWKIERMAKMDLAVLTVALYEIFYKDDIPDSVAINEAVDIAKKYGRDEASKFVNGVLGTIYRERTGAEEAN